MKFRTLVFVILASSVYLPERIALGAESMPLTFYRDSQDQISEQSKRNAVTMRKIVATEGYITLWVMLDLPFNVYMDEMTTEEIAAQIDAVAAEFAQVFGHLVAEGAVSHPKAGPLIKGPGSAVRANERGLNALLRDERIAQISATSFETK